MSRSLPTRPSLRQLRRQAKDLLRAYRSGDSEALERIRGALRRLTSASDPEVRAEDLTLQDVQHVLAVEHGFAGWAELVRHVDAPDGDTLVAAHAALAEGDRERLERLLVREPELAQRRAGPDKPTLLHLAAWSPDPECVHLLLERGADPSARYGEGWTPLHAAAEGDHVTHVSLLLAGGADVSAEACGDGGTPLAHALSSGARGAAELLATRAVLPENLRVAAGLGDLERLAAHFAPDGALRASAGAGRGFYRHHEEYPTWTPTDDPQEILDEAFVYACLNGRLAAADLLLARGAHVDGMPYYMTGLHAAVQADDLAMVEALLERGARDDLIDRMHGGTARGWTEALGRTTLRDRLEQGASGSALWLAVRSGDTARVRPLAAACEERERLQAFRLAASYGQSASAAELLAAGVQVSLLELIDAGLEKEVAERLAHGADPNASRKRRIPQMGHGPREVDETALMAAASGGWRTIGERLADAGATVDLHGAAFLGHLDRLQLLLGDRTPDEPRDPFGRTALHRAIEGGDLTVASWLLEHGASTATSSDGFSCGPRALHLAARVGATEGMLDLLIAAGADPREKSNPGTPLSLALSRGHRETADALRARGARD